VYRRSATARGGRRISFGKEAYAVGTVTGNGTGQGPWTRA
jgi:hypothetical protein